MSQAITQQSVELKEQEAQKTESYQSSERINPFHRES